MEKEYQLLFAFAESQSATGDGAYAVYWWDGTSENTRLLWDLTDVIGKDGKRKAKALLPLDESPTRLRVLILFDGEKQGAPVEIKMTRP